MARHHGLPVNLRECSVNAGAAGPEKCIMHHLTDSRVPHASDGVRLTTWTTGNPRDSGPRAFGSWSGMSSLHVPVQVKVDSGPRGITFRRSVSD